MRAMCSAAQGLCADAALANMRPTSPNLTDFFLDHQSMGDILVVLAKATMTPHLLEECNDGVSAWGPHRSIRNPRPGFRRAAGSQTRNLGEVQERQRRGFDCEDIALSRLPYRASLRRHQVT